MKVFYFILIGSLFSSTLAGQSIKVISVYLKTQINYRFYDPYGKGAGFGNGIEIEGNFHSKFKPILGFNWDLYAEAKVFKTENGKPLYSKASVPALFFGGSFHPVNRLFFSFEAGPAFMNSRVYTVVKPGMGFYFDKDQRFRGSLTFTHIFKSYESVNDASGYLSLGFALRVF